MLYYPLCYYKQNLNDIFSYILLCLEALNFKLGLSIYSYFYISITKYLTFQVLDIDEIWTHFFPWNIIKSHANNNVKKVKYWLRSLFLFDFSFDHQLFTFMYPIPITLKHKRKGSNVRTLTKKYNVEITIIRECLASTLFDRMFTWIIFDYDPSWFHKNKQ